MTDSKTASSEERPAAIGKTVTRVIGEPVQPNFEIRYHPKRPFSYEVAKYGGGIHTVVERLGRPSESGGSLVKAIRLQYGTWKRVLPYLIRFAKDTITPLGKRRVSLYLICTILLRLIAAWQQKAAWDVLDIIRKAVEARSISKRQLLNIALLDILGHLLASTIKDLNKDNQARLTYRFRSLINDRILQTRVRLDHLTSSDERVKGHLMFAQQLLGESRRGTIFLEQLVTIVGRLCEVTTEALLFYRVSGSSRRSASAILALKVALLFRHFFRMGYFYRTHVGITHAEYRRMEVMARLAEQSGAQDQVLGLRGYYFDQYKHAAESVGSIAAAAPNVNREAWRRPIEAHIFKVLQRLNNKSIFLFFGLHAVSGPALTRSGAAVALADLLTLRSGLTRLSGSIFRLLQDVMSLARLAQPIRQFYALEQIEPRLRIREQTIPYASVAGSLDILEADHGGLSACHGISNMMCAPLNAPLKRTGMSIEFRNVTFRYPHAKTPALDNVSFRIEAGELCSIVGFSGSGKTSLIALLVRLHDPQSGTILINGEDITAYQPEELYSKISMLFQQTAKLGVNMREFIRMGRLDATDAEVEEAVEGAGATEIIASLTDGYDTELESHGPGGKAMSVRQLVFWMQIEDQRELWSEGKDLSIEDSEEDDDGKTDEATDEQTRQALAAACSQCLGPQAPLAEDALVTKARQKTRARAICTELPEPFPMERFILADDYDPGAEAKKPQTRPANFSGGEWAKIVMARSFLRKDVDLLILDEFSAALDPMSEADIFKKFLLKRSKMTMIAVTHRFHLAARSDRILFMKRGKVLENGTHQELMRLGGEYASMYRQTSSAGANSKEVAIQTEEVNDKTGG